MIHSFHDWEWRGYRQVGAEVHLFLGQPAWMTAAGPREQVLKLVDVEMFAFSEPYASTSIVSEISATTVAEENAATVHEEIRPYLIGGRRLEDIDRLVAAASATGLFYVAMSSSYGGSFCAICRSIEGGQPHSIAA